MRLAGLATTLLGASAAGAVAAPILVSPGDLVARGEITVVLVYADAGDVSALRLGGGVLLNNRSDALGTARAAGTANGTVTFSLDNLTQGYGFRTGAADGGTGGDGAYHALYASGFEEFGVGRMSDASARAVAALQGPVTYVGFEDRRGGDYDYNDLIFAFSSVVVPEPASAALFGAGLLGLAAVRRRRA